MSSNLDRSSIEAAAPAGSSRDWASTPERSNLVALRVMAWIARFCGRRVARVFMHPIALYFLLFASSQKRNAKRYMGRVLPRPHTWRDGYRQIHAFACTVLDRVYFLRGRHDLFDVRADGVEPVDAMLRSGQGAFMIGAHFGSFEALGATTRLSGARDWPAAMLMFPDNARRITQILDALSVPGSRPHVIALGHPGSMLEVRDWLDVGGIAGALADRTLPGESQRGAVVKLPFLGREAPFNDGPFRLAALLRRRVFFMAGIYMGGNRYDVRFIPLADFSERAPHGQAREAQIGAAVQAYAAQLEALCRAHPYNWFNFHDFWNEDRD